MSGAEGLLRALASGARSVDALGRATVGVAPLESAGFSDLLAGVAGGGVESGQRVRTAAGVSLDPPLTREETEAVSAALDRADASGSSRALVLLGERALEVDVLTREIIGESRLRANRPATGIDAVVVARVPGSESGDEEDAAPAGPPGTIAGSDALLGLLGGRRGEG